MSPYKDKEQRKQASRDSMKKKRKGLTSRVNKDGVNIEMVPVTEFLPERPRHLTLSDGQVLDRANQPSPNRHITEMIACNRSDALRLGTGSETEKAARLLMIGRSLDKDYTALDGKKGKLSDLVRYGIGGPTLTQVREELG